MIGPQDYIDELLVNKYSEKQVNNIQSDLTRYTMDPEKYWDIMKDYSQVKMAMYNISRKFQKPQTKTVNALPA